ncbi:hypothetical protein [Photobacterium kishitanii]|uniref:Glucosamine inositolphosphorylceramide transferase 1 N-terminal domain-containing protein n=1 Tax=Photobacterium kishitanii TaxID=318456 RepID=A0A2T3QYS3_9GAMM|nr:hypothetical protein [Photobacterium kishitanii]OBU29449.1 hypothetical protein AYY23_06685 [Photobacterium kishitanii]PSU17604.1 hypothetical protein CTM84_18540 [Photobacterium kishitanii]PSU92846.1 hypothetical protein C9J27_21990 [Photobacterium kishitanii]PSV13201.1 hypothetical protein C0W59_16995 [Photobacterium kishitanii]PSW49783.1 hypothetical protein C0W66_08835 [Photobacterium kishitanii]
MKLLNKFTDQDFWRIGLIREHPLDVIINGLNAYDIHWFNFTDKDFEADPFVFTLNNKDYIAYEIFDYSHGNGKIECVDFDGKRYSFFDDVNKIVGHKSFPFTFEEENELYSIVETSDLNELALYKFTGVKFEKVKTLLSGEKYIDTCIKKVDGIFYLFTSTSDQPFKQQLFFANSLLGDYQTHPCSPIANDKAFGRNGGPIVDRDNNYYRVCQNCAITYGGSLKVMHITELSKTVYKEVFFKDVMPVAPFSDGIHTLSYWDNMTVIDSKNILSKYGNIYRKINYLAMVKLGKEIPYFGK